MSEQAPPDQPQRNEALDPSRSFIVQAPAGSGKTGLLVQRYLRLLACVDEPEEVLAVTFTRKAAAEMRNRVIAALDEAGDRSESVSSPLRRTRELARDALLADDRQGWQLRRHPARLRISTIDAVSAWLAGRAPLGSGAGTTRRISETPEILYEEAARATLGHLVFGGENATNLVRVLRHFDNDTERFERLVIAMLPRRDQWLRQVLSASGDRLMMEEPLRHLTGAVLQQAAACMDHDLQAEIVALLSFAARQLRLDGRKSALSPWAGRLEFPRPEVQEIHLWQSLCGTLLTASGEDWRRRVDVRLGFPPRSPEKARMEEVLERCSRRSGLLDAFAEVLRLPATGYTDEQWAVLQAILAVLKLAAAELKLVFAARGETDFAEVAADALGALGNTTGPTDLGLALDHRVTHILVDEFQDTSVSQFQLLQQLTAGWVPGDGRTIFLVGDPMQSIYRFREAEVGLFMQARDHGIGDLHPTFLQLAANFRCDPGIVAWVNRVFDRVLPSRDDPDIGSVRFAPSRATRASTNDESAGVMVHWLPAARDAPEADSVVDIVEKALARWPSEDICILVRSRSHARRIIAGLRCAGLAFIAPEIEDLEQSSVAQDLLALTRALLHPADRLAWIGVLRAPWCGLSLQDLDELLGDDCSRSVPEILCDASWEWSRLSPLGRAALERLRPVIERADELRGRCSLRDLVEGAWLDLAGAATIRDAAEMESAESFLRILESADTGGDCRDVLALSRQMRRHRGSLGSGYPGVQVMTMHKAKGLEFDTVILPGLAYTTRNDDSPLLAWQDVISEGGHPATVLAPIPATGADDDPLYRYLLRIERRKQAAETARLLYVACTRARKRLHLVAGVRAVPDDGSTEPRIRKPAGGSLLERLWPVLADEANSQTNVLAADRDPGEESRIWVQPPLRRLPADWRSPAVPAGLVSIRASSPPESAGVDYHWASNWAMCAGSVVHRWLKYMAEQGVAQYDGMTVEKLRPVFRSQLRSLGTASDALHRATDRVVEALSGALGDERGRWLLSAGHTRAECELAVTVRDGSRFTNLVIDRTFVDQDGTRWLIEFKTSSHEGGDLGAFLRAEVARHREQLERYREALAAIWNEPIRSALYFPVLQQLVEVQHEGGR
ncbi:MAG: UvrD-helicase domain-containing protein [Gammaproteobacteria bacterium]|nr:MAG: UvrD-helicase domain-containing protein [Gammaproteobacteria bacterium]